MWKVWVRWRRRESEKYCWHLSLRKDPLFHGAQSHNAVCGRWRRRERSPPPTRRPRQVRTRPWRAPGYSCAEGGGEGEGLLSALSADRKEKKIAQQMEEEEGKKSAQNAHFAICIWYLPCHAISAVSKLPNHPVVDFLIWRSLQGGPSGRGRLIVDIKFKVPL